MNHLDDLIGDYLGRLERLTTDLPSELRADVLDDVRAHLEEARLHATSEAEVRETLDRLGTPEAIAAEARTGSTGGVPPMPPPVGRPGDRVPPMPPPGSQPRRGGVRAADVIAIALLSLGSLLLVPLIGYYALIAWIIGAVMLWVSPTWTNGEKTLGTLIWPGGLLLPAALAFLPGQTCEIIEEDGTIISETCTGFSFPILIGVPLMLVTVTAPIVVAIVLLRRAGSRAR